MFGLDAAALSALVQVIVIDLTLAGDNAVAVGLAASGLALKQRRQAIWFGTAAAVIMLIGFALVAVQLLQIIGLLFGGGLLLLYVCWKMWMDIRHGHAEEVGEEALTDPDQAPTNTTEGQPRTFRQALITILLADLSMSLDNVLAVAGAAREHPEVLIFGLLLRIVVTAVAATLIARLLQTYKWLAYVCLALVLYVALNMMWSGHRDVVQRLNYTAQYNAFMPDFADIRPGERRGH